MATVNPSRGKSGVLVMDTAQANSTTTLATLTDLGPFLNAGATYHLRFVLHYTSAVTTTGARFVLTGPGAPTVLSFMSQQSLTATTLAVNFGSALALPAAASATSLLTGNMAVIETIIKPSASGQHGVQFASEVAASVITVLAGSFVQVQQLLP